MITLKKGEILFRQEEIGPLYHLHKGLLKVTRLKEDGTSTLVNLLLPGEIFPHHSLLTPNKYFGTVIAGVTCEIEMIPSEVWYEQIEHNPAQLRQASINLQMKLSMMQQRIDQLTAITPAERFHLFRQWFSTNFPDLVLNDALTQEEIGQFIGVTRETINRLFRNL